MHIVGVTGSLRAASGNTALLRLAGKQLIALGHTFDLFVPNLPLFNQVPLSSDSLFLILCCKYCLI